MTDTANGDLPLLLNIANLIRFSLLAEVSATPKPGLVDLHDNGAHTDMCYDTFARSTEAITPYLTRMFAAGLNAGSSGGRENPPHAADADSGLFSAIRPIGLEAERAMFRATGGVNTHKGIIFSMGLIAASAGRYYRLHGHFRPEDILRDAGAICRDSLEEDFRRIDPSRPATHGEILYVRYGYKGIRGEAQQGFPSIRDISLPAMRSQKKTCENDNQVYLNTLLSLMSRVDDTNVLIRTGPEWLAFTKAEAVRILRMGGASTPEGLHELEHLNEEFIKLRISPGGCADLLAITIFLWHLEHY